MTRLVLCLTLLLPALAFARPKVSDSGGWVRGSVEIEADKARVLEFLRDPHNISRVEGRGTKIEVRASSGCDNISAEIPTIVGAMRYVSRRCPIDGGFQDWLVSSEDFAAYEAIWNVEATANGVELRYQVRTEPTLPVPSELVVRQSKRAVRKLLRALREHLEEAEAS